MALKPGSLLVFLLCLLSAASPVLRTHSFINSRIHQRRDIFSPVENIINQRRTKKIVKCVRDQQNFFANLHHNNTPLDHQHHRALQMLLGCLSCYEESFTLLVLPGPNISQLDSYAVIRLYNDIKHSAFVSVVPRMDVKAAGLYLPTKLHDILFHSTTILILTTLKTSNNNEPFTV